MPNRSELLVMGSKKGIRRTMRENKHAEALQRNAKTPIEKRSRKTDTWKVYLLQ